MQPLLLQVHKNASSDAAILDLVTSGVALIALPPESSLSVPATAFATCRQVLDGDSIQQHTPTMPYIANTDDSAHATGYHSVGRMSARYNAYREGFVFSDGTQFGVETCPAFRPATTALHELLHDTADAVLEGLSQHLQLPTTTWFHNALGPTRNHSQWHIKRYVAPPTSFESDRDQETTEWLPVHTDPSLISIVVQDHPGCVPGAAGLQYFVPQDHRSNPNGTVDNDDSSAWRDVPWSGHAVAIVIVGSVLHHVTGGYVGASRHRVVYQHGLERGDDPISRHSRMAATLFVRPAPQSRLFLPPSPLLKDRRVKGQLTFQQWLARTARNYEKAKRKEQVSNATKNV